MPGIVVKENAKKKKKVMMAIYSQHLEEMAVPVTCFLPCRVFLFWANPRIIVYSILSKAKPKIQSEGENTYLHL